ncbi:MAG: antibiotic biosynthesis monooxygenase [Chloroflexota bacterium]|nr:antibiotic biosynthesis monooxygenase [Chloroflexota bacterium]
MIVVQNRLIGPAALAEHVEQGFAHASANMKELPGFVDFKLLRAEGEVTGLDEGEVLYVAHTLWRDRASYEAWRDGDAFAKAHSGRNSGSNSPLKSTLEVFESVLEKA